MTRTLEILERLVAHPTLSRTRNLDLVDWVVGILQTSGFAVTRIPSPCGTKAGVVARLGPDGPGGICLSGHTDVVPTEGQDWSTDPFTLTQRGTRVMGRGTTDMKGFVASTLSLAERAGNAVLQQPLRLVLSYDEEVGCTGIQEMLPALRPLLGEPGLTIVGEPTSMQVATGHKGKAAFHAVCQGDAGHSALAPRFINAIHVATAFVSEIRALQDSLARGLQDPAYDIPYSTVHVGRIEGGRALNIVPDHATLEMELRCLAHCSDDEALSALSRAARKVGSDFGRPDLITVRQTNSYPGLDQDPEAEAVTLALDLAGKRTVTKVAFGTEAGFFAGLGCETVVVGPGSMADDGHKPDEGIDLDQLHACDAMMDRIWAQLTQA